MKWPRIFRSPIAQGTTLGRSQTGAVEKRVREPATAGMGKLKIARTLGIGVSGAWRVLSSAGG